MNKTGAKVQKGDLKYRAFAYFLFSLFIGLGVGALFLIANGLIDNLKEDWRETLPFLVGISVFASAALAFPLALGWLDKKKP